LYSLSLHDALPISPTAVLLKEFILNTSAVSPKAALWIPVMLAKSAKAPVAVLPSALLFSSAAAPTAVLSLPWLNNIAAAPTAVLRSKPLRSSAAAPTAVLKLPVELAQDANQPNAEFPKAPSLKKRAWSPSAVLNRPG